MPGRRTETDGPEPTVGRTDQISQLGPNQRSVFEGMLLDDQLIPERTQRILPTTEQMKKKTLDLIHPAGQSIDRRQRLPGGSQAAGLPRSEEHTSELQSQSNIVCR